MAGTAEGRGCRTQVIALAFMSIFAVALGQALADGCDEMAAKVMAATGAGFERAASVTRRHFGGSLRPRLMGWSMKWFAVKARLNAMFSSGMVAALTSQFIGISSTTDFARGSAEGLLLFSAGEFQAFPMAGFCQSL